MFYVYARSIFFTGLLLSCTSAASSPQASKNLIKSMIDAPAPGNAAESQLNWIISVFNDKQGKVSRDEIEQHFAESFLKIKPADEMAALIAALTKQFGSISPVSTELTPTAAGMESLIVRIETAHAGMLRMLLTVNLSDRKISGLLFQPDAPIAVPTTPDDIEKTLSKAAEKSTFLATEVKDGSCQEPILTRNAQEPLAIGSAFKLYVLGAAIDAVNSGKMSWTDSIAIEDKLKSLPSGKMQDEAEGKTFSVFTMAQEMIAISDNTATDHLFMKLGRDAVETAFKTYGNAHLTKNTPVMTTRELFLLKAAALQGTVLSYLEKTTAEKRRYLDTELARQRPALEDFKDWTSPQHISELEWFASSDDICRAMARFQGQLDKKEDRELGRVLSKNPGVPFNTSTFPFIGFKGGSEPGVASLNWILKRADGRWFVLSVTANDSTKDVDLNTLIGVAQAGAELIGNAP